MSYTRATLADFQAIFGEFAGVNETQYAYWATRAERVIDAAFGDDQQHGTMLLTAHYLTMQGLGTGAESMRATQFGGADKVKSGSLELSWSGGGSSSSGRKTTGSKYGDEVRDLVVSVKGGPKVTGTGALPPSVSYGNA